jgi:hypothetical protein
MGYTLIGADCNSTNAPAGEDGNETSDHTQISIDAAAFAVVPPVLEVDAIVRWDGLLLYLLLL